MATSTTFEIPNGKIISVELINAVNFGPAQLDRFMSPPVPGLKTLETLPSCSFLLEHESGRKLVFDLGIRKDYLNYAPKIASYIPTTGYNINVEKNVADILIEGGIPLESIEAVVWGHWHWDHIGDPSTFPASTDLIVGPGFKGAMLPGAPSNPDSPIQVSDYEGRNLREVSFNGPNFLRIGKFPAFDYFGDGSFYLLDSPGHAIGHLSGLARTTTQPPTFIFLGGDICHYPGIFRPSKHLPVPSQIVPHPLHPETNAIFCPGTAFEELQTSRGRTATDTVYDITFGHDIPLATRTMHKLQEADCEDHILVIIAHDAHARDYVHHFPLVLNDWKANGWGSKLQWAFLRDLQSWWSKKGSI